ncbi:MAG: APC family permease [Blastocatellia bacterium]
MTTNQSPGASPFTLRRALGVTGAAAFVITNMIGTGIFTVPAFVRATTGSGLGTFAVWITGALVALCGALCYAELATRMPEAGGEYQYLTRVYGPMWGFLSGWISFLVGFSSALAASALGAAAYAKSILPQWNPGAAFLSLPNPLAGIFATPPQLYITQGALAAACLLLSLAVFHQTGVKTGGALQKMIGALVISAILGLVMLGFLSGSGNVAGLTASTPATGAWWVALIQVSFAYSGWNAAAYLAGEVVNPRHTLPRALIGGTLITALLYLLLNALFLYALPANGWNADIAIGRVAAEYLFGPTGALIVGGIITLTIIGSVSSMTAAGPRVYYAMAQDGLAPAIFGRLGRHGAPTLALWTQAAASILLALTGAFEALLIYAGAAMSLMTSLAVSALWVLPRPAPDEAGRIFRAPGYPITPAIFVLLNAAAFIQGLRMRPGPTGAALATIVIGMCVYLAGKRLGWFKKSEE